MPHDDRHEATRWAPAEADDALDDALDDGTRRWSHAELRSAAQAFAALLAARGVRRLATLVDNSPAWVIADLGAAWANVVHVPLPAFFTAGQIAHALQAAGVDAVLAEPAAPWTAPEPERCMVGGRALVLVRVAAATVALPPGTAKITFTSGTTGAPKGVCLDAPAMGRVADGLVRALAPLAIERHLCALPFALLLENVAGLMTPLAQGAVCITLPLARLGLEGSSRFDPARLHAAVLQHRPESLIVLPQMLRAWAAWLATTRQRAPASLKLVAVGGAPVGARLVGAARAVGLPACEGYGLSEGASVQTLNLPGADRPGSVGRPLPHAQLRVADDGELLVAGSLFVGYLGDAAPPPRWWPTGDLGRIDADGFVHVHGRKTNVLITAYGRNVSPEWVETALCGEAAIAQAAVFGDGLPALAAVLWPVRAELPDAALQVAVDAANATLPDYARVGRWVRARGEFTAASGLATPNGRPQRRAILQRHADVLGIADTGPTRRDETPTATH